MQWKLLDEDKVTSRILRMICEIFGNKENYKINWHKLKKVIYIYYIISIGGRN